MNKNKHEFALYCDGLSSLLPSVSIGGQLCIMSESIHHRITRVLKLHIGESLLLFDRSMHVQAILRNIRSSRDIDFEILTKEHNRILTPTITFFTPLLKRDNLDTALYALVEMGVNNVQLVMTEKAQRHWGGDKEFSRLERVMIAAAEQSKNFSYPELYSPIPFETLLDITCNITTPKFFFDMQGRSLSSIVYDVQNELPKELRLLVGPEGDLMPAEKNAIQDAGFIFCALTSTILRAQQAIALSAGIFRSIFT